jgi:hypothetical protein
MEAAPVGMKAGPTPVVKAVFHLVDILDVILADDDTVTKQW